MNTLEIYAHSQDRNIITFPNGREVEGDYVPNNIGIGGDDVVQLTIDIDTGAVVGWNDDLKKAVLEFQESLPEPSYEDWI